MNVTAPITRGLRSPGSEGITVSALRTAAAIRAEQWDGLVDIGEMFGSHEWVRHLEEAGGTDPVLACRVEGTLAAAVPMWSADQSQGRLFDLTSLRRDIDGAWTQPWIWLGARRSVHNTLPCTSGPHRARVQASVLDVAARRAATSGMAGVIMPYMPVRAAHELAASDTDAHVLLHAAEATVAVPAGGGEAVVARARGHHNRKRRRQEWSAFREAGFTIEEAELETVAEEAAELITHTRQKHGSRDGSEWMRRVLAAQSRVGLTDRAVALVCRRSTRMTAVAVCYRHGQTLHGRYYGARNSLDARSPVYFIMTSHVPVSYAAAAGLTTVNLATSSLEAKTRRGAQLDPLAAVVVPVSHTIDDTQVFTHNQRFVANYRSRFASALSPSWPAAVSGLTEEN